MIMTMKEGTLKAKQLMVTLGKLMERSVVILMTTLMMKIMMTKKMKKAQRMSKREMGQAFKEEGDMEKKFE